MPPWLTAWLPSATAFVAGGGLVGWLSHFNPVWTAVGAFASGFVGKVWAKLEPGYVESCAAWIEATRREKISGYYRYYAQQIIYSHRNLNVKGLSDQGPFALELQQVFVELSLNPEAISTGSGDLLANPLRIPPELSSGSHSVWEWLSSPALQNSHFVILGAPGTGKTTLLQNIAFTLAAPAVRRSRRGRIKQAVKPPQKIPVLIFLRDIAKMIEEAPEDKTPSLADAIRASMTRAKIETGTPGWFEKQLQRGRCLVLLDGLDEVADPAARRKVVAWVQQQIRTQGNNRFVITSRPFGYRDNRLEDVAVLGTRPFSGEQVERFVRNWYLAYEMKSQQRDDEGVRRDADKGAEDLLRRLKQAPTLAELAVNPLLLTMIAHVHKFRSSLPGRRVELYQEICLVFLGRKQQAAGIELDLTPQQKQAVLQPLAYHMMNKRQATEEAADSGLSSRDVTVEEAETVIKEVLAGVTSQYTVAAFLKMIENSSGLLIERGTGVYMFSHLTFQEYLAAAHIHEQKSGDELLAHIDKSWWHETIRLYVAQGDGTALIRACLDKADAAPTALVLALECESEAKSVEPAVRAWVQKLLDDGVESTNPELRRRSAEALLLRRLKNLRRESDALYVDNSLLTHAEYQLFLDEKRSLGKYYQPDHWTTTQFAPGTGQQPVAGVRLDDAIAFCAWLTERQRDGWTYRLPRPEEPWAQEIIPGPVGYWVRSGSYDSNCIGGTRDQVSPHLEGVEKLAIEQPAFAATFVPVLGNVSDLVLAHARVLDRVLDRDRDRAFALGLTLDRTFNRDHVLARDLARDLDRSFDRALTFDFVHVLDRGVVRAHAHALVRALVHNIDFDLNFARTHATVLLEALQTVQEHPGLLPLHSKLWLEAAVEANMAIVFILESISRQSLPDLVKLRMYLHRYSRLNLLWWWFNAEAQRKGWRVMSKRGAEQEELLTAYASLILLEKRITGQQQAFEGIRIVREKATKDSLDG